MARTKQTAKKSSRRLTLPGELAKKKSSSKVLYPVIVRKKASSLARGPKKKSSGAVQRGSKVR